MKTWTDIERAANAQILEWAEAQPWARDMATCQQDAQWHAEGDVWTHTKTVCAELERLAEWPALDHATQIKLLFTGLFHDSGKPATTALDPETGRTRSPKHAPVGAEIAGVCCGSWSVISLRGRESQRSFVSTVAHLTS